MELQQIARSFLLDWFGRFVVFTAVSWIGLQTSVVARAPARKALLCAASAAAIYVVIASPVVRFATGWTLDVLAGSPVAMLAGLLVWVGGLVLQVVLYWLIFSFCLDAYVRVGMEDDAGVTARSVIPAMIVWLAVRLTLGAFFPEFVTGEGASAAQACYG